MQRRRQIPLGSPGSATWILLVLGVVAPALAWAEVDWLPPSSLFPRLHADLREPRIGITYAPDPDFIDAALGAPIPLLGFSAGERPVVLVMEAAALFRLGRDGSFFPLESMDGVLGLGIESEAGPVKARFRLTHISAHKADGSPTVKFRDPTFSREFWSLEGGYLSGGWFLSARLGASWHAVPKDHGLDLAVGANWEPQSERAGRPFAEILFEADAERDWRINQSLIIGWATGRASRAEQGSLRVGMRLVNGNSHRGQYWTSPEKYLGLNFIFNP